MIIMIDIIINSKIILFRFYNNSLLILYLITYIFILIILHISCLYYYL